ncbi:hypothetical protein GA0115240_11841 [Streptomyces sp. DvalAA-14]|nr:hypothetical protein [Streptomyces sp. SID4948]SCD66116.1 hypothetical protein GA0115240_11841 [Streptomyces sp. DvalAA-14]
MAEELFQDPDALKHTPVHDRDGRLIASVAQVYVDIAKERHPEWVAVRGGPHGAQDTFVPLRGAGYDQDGVLRVAYSLETVAAAPRINADQHLTLDQEQELYVHYGLTPPTDEPSGAPGVGSERPKLTLTGDEAEVEEVAELAADRPLLRKFVPADYEQPSTGATRVDGDTG